MKKLLTAIAVLFSATIYAQENLVLKGAIDTSLASRSYVTSSVASKEAAITAPHTTFKYWTGYKTFGSFFDSARAAFTGTSNRITITSGVIDLGTDAVTLTGSQVLTNKTLTQPIINSSSSADTTTYKPFGVSSGGVTRAMTYWPGSGGGSGVTTMAAIGSTANANGATISSTTLNLQPASASFGGVVTTGTQGFAGDKSLAGTFTVTNSANTNTLSGITSGTFPAIYAQNTTSGNNTTIYVENNRGSFASYGGYLYGGSTVATSIFGLTRADRLFMFADGASNLGMGVGTLSAQPLVIGTNNVERMRVLSNGDVIQGATASSAGSFFEIQKNQNAGTYQSIINTTSGTAGFAGFYCSNSASLASFMGFAALSAGWTTSGINVANTGTITSNMTGGMNIGASSAAQLSLWTNNTKRLTILSTGEVGIGTATPALVSGSSNAFMEFSGSTNPGFALRNTTGAKQYFFYVGSTGTNTFSIYDATSGADRFQISTAGVTSLYKGANVASASTITATGNSFHVTGNTSITSVSGTGITAGTTITIIFDGALTFTDGSNLKLAGNFTTAADATITLHYDGTNFYEITRSTN